MRNEILIDAPADRIFRHASATDRWPELLPHYRYVRVMSSEGDRRVVEMAAKRPLDGVGIGIPVRWRAEQINDPALPQISFRHIAGWTKGMLVYWHFTAEDGKTRVQIDHEWSSPLARFIGKYFVDPIATRTLARMKEICECS